MIGCEITKYLEPKPKNLGRPLRGRPKFLGFFEYHKNINLGLGHRLNDVIKIRLGGRCIFFAHQC